MCFNWRFWVIHVHMIKYLSSCHYRQVVDQHMFHRLLDIIPCKYRIALTRLIVSSHRLRVETGRWERPVVQYESRLCHVRHKLDDEYHFLLECDRYAELRARLIPRYYWVRASMYKCIQLLSSNNRKTVRLLSKYTTGQKFGIFGKHNGNSSIWHRNLLQMAWHQPQINLMTIM